MAGTARGKRLIRSLEDSLGADIDPTSCRHLAVHRQAEPFEAAELVPRCPLWNKHRVADEDAGRVRMRLEDPHGLSGLDDQRFVVLQLLQARDDGVKALPVP